MYTMLPFRDQKGDAAKALLKQDTMECMVKVRGEKCFPLLLYIVMTFYWTGVFINPDFTRPYLVAHYLFTAKGILDMLESFVELHKLPKDIYLMSSASRRTINSMCHTGIHHPLKMYRKAEQMAYVLDKYWRRASLKAVNTKPMEGYHGSIRTDGNDFNKAPDEWCDSTSAMVMKRNILNRLMLNYGVEIGAPKNTIRENQGKTSSLAIDPVPDVLRGLVGTAGLVSTQDVTHGLPCSPNVVPEQYAIEITSYRQLHDTMKAGAQSGLQNALNVLEKLAANLSNDLKSAPPNRFGKWKVFNRPVGMKLVMDDDIAAAPFEPAGADGVPKPDKVVRAEMAAMAAEGPASVDAPSSRVSPAGSSVGAETDKERLKRLDEIINNNRDSKKQLSKACNSGALVLPEQGKDVKQVSQNQTVILKDGSVISLRRALKMLNPREWIDRNRWPRFWTPAVLPEHKALPTGHNCTLGTMIVVTYGAKEETLIALARVHRLYSGDKPESSSTIKPQNGGQRFMVELCLPTSSDANGALRFVASGRHLPMTNGKQVMGLASVASEGLLSHAATMSAGVVKELTQKAQFVTINNLSAETLVPQKHTSIADETEKGCCCRCQFGWWDDSTGKILYCDGPCDRGFHTSCAGLDNVPEGDWLCARCTGEDNAVCVVCDKEWFCDEPGTEDGKPKGYYKGSMIQCASVCEHWFHQECHHPAIPGRYVCTEIGSKGRGSGAKMPSGIVPAARNLLTQNAGQLHGPGQSLHQQQSLSVAAHGPAHSSWTIIEYHLGASTHVKAGRT
jgi:hypothetical protein